MNACCVRSCCNHSHYLQGNPISKMWDFSFLNWKQHIRSNVDELTNRHRYQLYDNQTSSLAAFTYSFWCSRAIFNSITFHANWAFWLESKETASSENNTIPCSNHQIYRSTDQPQDVATTSDKRRIKDSNQNCIHIYKKTPLKAAVCRGATKKQPLWTLLKTKCNN